MSIDSAEKRRSVLVVIPTLNEARTIHGLLDSLRSDLPSDAEVQFVVADGGSTDDTAGIVSKIAARDSRVRLMHNPQRLQSAAVNLAARTHSFDTQVLVRCDAHALYPPAFVGRLLASLDKSQADAVVVPMDSVGDGCLQRAVAWASDTPVGSGGSAHRGGRRSGFVDHGHHAAFRMESFRRAGGYDESYSHNEDAELDCRQRACGSRIFLDADIRLTYHPRSTLTGLWRQYFGYGRGRARTGRRHPGSMRARQFAVPAHFAFSILALLIAPWFPWLLIWPMFYLAVLVAVSTGISFRRGSACGLLAGPAAGVMHTAWAAGFFWSLLTVREVAWHHESASPLWQSDASSLGPAS